MSREDPTTLRRELLSVKGIGPETGDSILCYAAGATVLVIDAYTKRLVGRLSPRGWGKDLGGSSPSYSDLQETLMGRLQGDSGFYNRFHALVVLECKDICRTEPLCSRCPLLALCDTGRKRI